MLSKVVRWLTEEPASPALLTVFSSHILGHSIPAVILGKPVIGCHSKNGSWNKAKRDFILGTPSYHCDLHRQ